MRSRRRPSVRRHAQDISGDAVCCSLVAAREWRVHLCVALTLVAPRGLADSMPTAFTWADLSVHSSLRKAFGGSKATVVAVDAKAKTFAPYDGHMTPVELRDWAETFRGRLESDMDPLAGPMTFKREWRPRWSWRQLLRNMTPHLMTFIALVAAWLLWYAMQNLWSDWRSSSKSKKTREAIFKGRAKLLEGETRKLSKWEQLEKQNAEARERKRQAEEEKEAKRQAVEHAAAVARETDAAKARAEEARRAAAAAAARKQQQQQPQQPQPKAPAKEVGDDELKRGTYLGALAWPLAWPRLFLDGAVHVLLSFPYCHCRTVVARCVCGC
jgi:hypothetical protein